MILMKKFALRKFLDVWDIENVDPRTASNSTMHVLWVRSAFVTKGGHQLELEKKSIRKVPDLESNLGATGLVRLGLAY